MHPLHEYIAQQLEKRLKARRVVVWYDKPRKFAPFVAELRGDTACGGGLNAITVGGVRAQLAEFRGSFYEVRSLVEPLVTGDEPETVLIYLAGRERDTKGSVLMELEKAGDSWTPQLEQLAQNVLRERYTDGVIDDLINREGVTYEDLAHAAADPGAGDGPSILKAIFHDCSGNDAIVAGWLVREARDQEIVAKQATLELVKLVRSRLGLDLPADAPLAKLRAITIRYVLAGEFRGDLRCAPPPTVAAVQAPPTKEDERAVRAFAELLRDSHSDAYVALADRVEAELGLTAATVPAEALGSIDTFRFEEFALLGRCGELIADGRFDDAQAIARERKDTFWLVRDIARKAQWEACGAMSELGRFAADVRKTLPKPGTGPAEWVARYAAADGWFRLDQAQRRLEALIPTLNEHPAERPLGIVRRAYEDACHVLAEGFSTAFVAAGWSVPGVLHQTRVFSEVVQGSPRPVAYFLVDAMRYEMALDIVDRLPKEAETSLRPAITALPSITPVGMAALLPGAAASFSIDELDDELVAKIDGEYLANRAERSAFAAARIPNLADLALDELLQLQPTKLKKRLADAQVVLVRSQEIDQVGESGMSGQARQVMDTVIGNIVRAIKELSKVGIAHCVVTADHGHLFLATERDESMRIDAPGGKTVELHRRCWIGRGGANPPGCVRATAADLGYASNLEFVFPRGAGVLKSGGDLAFHHGGLSLQEIVIPVLTVRLPSAEKAKAGRDRVEVRRQPLAVTNRIISVDVQFESADSLFKQSIRVRVSLTFAGREVGNAALAIGGELNAATGELTLHTGQPANVGLFLRDDSVSSVQIVVHDLATDIELFRSPAAIPVSLGV